MSSADNLCKQLGTRSFCRSWPESKLFDTQMVSSLKEFSEYVVVVFFKYQQTTKSMKHYPVGKVLKINFDDKFIWN